MQSNPVQELSLAQLNLVAGGECKPDFSNVQSTVTSTEEMRSSTPRWHCFIPGMAFCPR
jgi:hypothetical protein